jgi:hypothetical protein
MYEKPKCSPSPGTLQEIQTIQVAQTLCPEGVWGPRLRNKGVKNMGAEGPTHFLHFHCAISAPRLPPDTMFVQF